MSSPEIVATAATEPAKPRDARTAALVTAPLLPLLLRLAAPNLVLIFVQTSVGLIEMYWVGRLGTDALAGTALVFPLLAIMQAMAAGSVGGGMSSAVARALGRGRRDEADALASHALILGVGFGFLFMTVLLAFGPFLYRMLGGSGAALSAALVYSNMIFAGMPLLWLFSAFASVLRGTGNMKLPAQVSTVGAVLLIPLSPLLIFGWGPFPALGVAGGGAAVILYYVGGSIVLGWRLMRGREVVRPYWRGLMLRWALFYEMLRVGLVAAMITLTTNATVAITTALIAPQGADAIAGYASGARLESLLVPLSFGFGGPLVAIVGTCIGAGAIGRAQRAAWLGAAISAAMAEAIGLAAATWPRAWIGLFGNTDAMLATGSAYLVTVGPVYGAFGLGMTLYFASQGAGRLLWPVSAALLRLAIGGIGGFIGLRYFGWGEAGLFVLLATALVAFGGVIAASIAFGAWSKTKR